MDIDARDDDETHLFGEVNVAKANTKLWLVKVPNFVAEEWLKSPAGMELGKVKIHRREGANQADVSPIILFNLKEYRNNIQMLNMMIVHELGIYKKE
jgi:hypothetical protein